RPLAAARRVPPGPATRAPAPGSPLRPGTKYGRGNVWCMNGDADIATVGALVADPARAKILLALGDGRALPASVLADEAGVAASTAGAHLGRLLDRGLLSVERP